MTKPKVKRVAGSRKCKSEKVNCTVRPYFNYPGNTHGMYCNKHKKDDMVNIFKQVCQGDGGKCPRYPKCNYEGQTKRLYCKIHMIKGMIDLSSKCAEKGCPKSKTFNYTGLKGKYCKDHALPNMIYVNGKRCQECDKIPVFNNPGVKPAILCNDHKKEGMIDVVNKKCENVYNNIRCTSAALFNYETESRGKFCSDHKHPNMINVCNDSKCKIKGCPRVRQYNKPGIKGAIYCVDHKDDTMINVVAKRCITLKCVYEALYNLPTETKRAYCVNCKQDDMIVINKKQCKEDGCPKTPTYGLIGTTIKLYCKEHSDEKIHERISSEKCLHPNCPIYPSYNLSGNNKREYCSEHKTLKMIPIISNKCQDCNRVAQFNFPGETKGIYCKKDAREGMINTHPSKHICKECSKPAAYNYINEKVRLYCREHAEPCMKLVGMPICKECNEYATYGFFEKPVTHCKEHHLKSMIKNPNQKCKYADGCTHAATHGFKKRMHCEKHAIKEDNEVNLIERLCISCGLLNPLNPNDKCEYCDPSQVKSTRLHKQNTVRDYLFKLYPNDNIIVDTIVNAGVFGKERPDFLFKLDNYSIIIEVDEFMHVSKSTDCENVRMKNIAQSLQHPVWFIRYNPDNYQVV